MSLIAEAPNFLQVFSDGIIKRFAPEIALASPNSSESYKSKDIVIDPIKPITGRIFLPNNTQATHASSDHKLPVLVYFHGGGFCIGSTTWLNYHIFLGDLASLAKVIVISIDYRLAPENRLPIAYYDGCTSLEWLIKSCNIDPWLKQADLLRVFISGDSAGGNIAHNVAIQSLKSEYDINDIVIKGILLVHPFFGSEERTSKEKVDESVMEVQMNDMFWKLSIPEGLNRDYFGCNFEMEQLQDCKWSHFPKVVVYVAEQDFLKERGEMYVEYLKRKGVSVKLIEAKDEGHVHHIYHPKSESAYLLKRQMTDFMNNS